MKNSLIKIICLITGILLFNTTYSQSKKEVNQNGYNKFYYDNGKISSEGTMRDGKPDGYWKTYLPSGVLKSEGNRKNYKLDSTWKFYDDKGRLTTVINYTDGKKNGIKKMFDSKGYITSEENYTGDIKQGLSYTYFTPVDSTQLKGRIQTQTPFDKGKENGTAYEYDKNGNIISILEYNYGVLTKQESINRVDKNEQKQGLWKKFYADGKVKAETTYINGKRTGYQKSYSKTGSLIDIQKYIGDSLQKDVPELSTKLEVRNEYYEDGSIKKTGTYLNGVAEGVQKEYSLEGKITNAKFFKEGNLVGEGLMDAAGNQQGSWVEYHIDGKIKGKGNYENGEKIGDWVFYYADGKTEQKGKYNKKGKPVGVWQWYYNDGNLLREENYINGKRDGVFTEWSDSGAVITKGEYIEGLKEGAWFYQLQDYKEQGSYKTDQKDGLWQSYYVSNSKLRSSGKFVEGLPDGKHILYYSDGKKQEEGKYIIGNKDGNWEYYNPDGTLLLTVFFKNNQELKFDGARVKPTLPGEPIK